MKHRKLLRGKRALGARGLAASVPVSLGAPSFVLTVLAILIFVFSVFNPQHVNGIQMSVTDAVSPLLQTVAKPIAGAAEIVRNASGLSDMQAENLKLRQENIRLREWYQKAVLLEAENKSLRNLLNVPLDPQYSTVAARVLADTENNYAKTILISSGQKEGVRKGQAVISDKGLVGRVIEVGQKTARVLLITDINSRVPVLIEETQQHAILSGDGENKAYLSHLAADGPVKKNARIITSGYGGMFPYGLVVGRVAEQKDSVAKMSSQKNQNFVKVKPFVDFGSVVHVRILEKTDFNLVSQTNP